MAEPVDHNKIKQLHDALVEARDAIAGQINHLDTEPPKTEEEYLAYKTQLMSLWRDLSIMRVQLADAIGRD